MSSAASSSQPTDTQTNSSMDNAMTTTTNVDPSEVDKFNKLASEWWDKTGAFATLHEINPLRLNWIEENVKRGYKAMTLIKQQKWVCLAKDTRCRLRWRYISGVNGPSRR